MEFFAQWLPRLISGVLSLLDASNLRTRVYNLEDEHELMWTALDDIKRMHKDHPSGKMAEQRVKKMTKKYGR
jgi:hypothetical protein